MVGILIFFPQLVMGLDKQIDVDTDKVEIVVPEQVMKRRMTRQLQFDAPANDDAAKALEKALQSDKK